MVWSMRGGVHVSGGSDQTGVGIVKGSKRASVGLSPIVRTGEQCETTRKLYTCYLRQILEGRSRQRGESIGRWIENFAIGGHAIAHPENCNHSIGRKKAFGHHPEFESLGFPSGEGDDA